jgi:2-polyprenyl-3-methyl-5-hydroxy-6-metoxy-1,4-benzoquinol methylase
MKKYTNPDYKPLYKTEDIQMGKIASYIYKTDPTHLLFGLSRYKFVAKTLNGFDKVLEIGFGDGFFSPLVKKNVNKLDGFDIDSNFVKLFNEQNIYSNVINFKQMDITKKTFFKKKYDAIFSLDTFEHIKPSKADNFLKFIIKCSHEKSVTIIGIPSLESQIYASELSKKGHVNCMSGEDLKKKLKNYFGNVFVFSMNDEVVHTGFSKMAHYLMALCTNPKLKKGK